MQLSQAEAAHLQQEVSLFAVTAQRKGYSQLISTHETFVGVLLARGIPDRGVLPRAGQAPASLKLGAKLAAVILQKEGRVRALCPPCLTDQILRNLGFSCQESMEPSQMYHRRVWVGVREEGVQYQALSIQTEG